VRGHEKLQLTYPGSLVTTATWLRNYVRSHPDYKFDSVVSQSITYDLCRAIDEVERGVRRADDLLGADYVGSGDLPRCTGAPIA